MIISAILGLIVVIGLFVGFGWFFSRTQDRSQRRFDANNQAGTLRREPYRRPDPRDRTDDDPDRYRS